MNAVPGGVGTDPRAALFRWTEQVAPTDASWFEGKMASLSGSLFVGDYVNGQLHRYTLDDAGTQVIAHDITFDHTGGIVEVSEGPGGWLYFISPATSAIYRIVPT